MYALAPIIVFCGLVFLITAAATRTLGVRVARRSVLTAAVLCGLAAPTITLLALLCLAAGVASTPPHPTYWVPLITLAVYLEPPALLVGFVASFSLLWRPSASR